MEVERPFIFVKQYPDGRVLLEMDPLQHYEISNIPDFSKQMILVYEECYSLLRQLSTRLSESIAPTLTV